VLHSQYAVSAHKPRYSSRKHFSRIRRFGVPLTPRPVTSNTLPDIGNSFNFSFVTPRLIVVTYNLSSWGPPNVTEDTFSAGIFSLPNNLALEPLTCNTCKHQTRCTWNIHGTRREWRRSVATRKSIIYGIAEYANSDLNFC